METVQEGRFFCEILFDFLVVSGFEIIKVPSTVVSIDDFCTGSIEEVGLVRGSFGFQDGVDYVAELRVDWI
ncbi:hypothetical protein HHK36_032622 [Tetracentron sinense]|uniref:Uncharacterized protein n=1 Tax=Tetracentron sinense TaxID=13715 RepID=A0A834Y746_TETSI|nr:hypothetical protein HHK36_032622 [Tetracentron sinense]